MREFCAAAPETYPTGLQLVHGLVHTLRTATALALLDSSVHAWTLMLDCDCSMRPIGLNQVRLAGLRD